MEIVIYKMIVMQFYIVIVTLALIRIKQNKIEFKIFKLILRIGKCAQFLFHRFNLAVEFDHTVDLLSLSFVALAYCGISLLWQKCQEFAVVISQ